MDKPCHISGAAICGQILPYNMCCHLWPYTAIYDFYYLVTPSGAVRWGTPSANQLLCYDTLAQQCYWPHYIYMECLSTKESKQMGSIYMLFLLPMLLLPTSISTTRMDIYNQDYTEVYSALPGTILTYTMPMSCHVQPDPKWCVAWTQVNGLVLLRLEQWL